ncbi:hypothetical protein [Mangrovivirga cuniculi]|uniref:Uncharacterized protein n=1 Tax=Mangrovivirga cuniculi TaxID=2715131 RepID=A0A4D7JF61_9BACT|nr:hypothetical protein [Mangrovivirga cuniculi]QCK13773.1 hypothetical protein DCC35_02870 [Mangrovivirga cuniculi]
MRFFYQLLLLIVVLCLTNCAQHTINDPEEYLDWYGENSENLQFNSNCEGYSFKLQYQPTAVRAIRNGDLTQLESFENSLVFVLDVESKADDLGRLNQYKQYLEYNSSELFQLTIEEQNYDPSLSIYEGFNSHKNTHRFTILFELSEGERIDESNIHEFSDVTFSIKDEIFCSQKAIININQDNFYSIPKFEVQ